MFAHTATQDDQQQGTFFLLCISQIGETADSCLLMLKWQQESISQIKF